VHPQVIHGRGSEKSCRYEELDYKKSGMSTDRKNEHGGEQKGKGSDKRITE
jgi:hypothetical protein